MALIEKLYLGGAFLLLCLAVRLLVREGDGRCLWLCIYLLAPWAIFRLASWYRPLSKQFSLAELLTFSVFLTAVFAALQGGSFEASVYILLGWIVWNCTHWPASPFFQFVRKHHALFLVGLPFCNLAGYQMLRDAHWSGSPLIDFLPPLFQGLFLVEVIAVTLVLGLWLLVYRNGSSRPSLPVAGKTVRNFFAAYLCCSGLLFFILNSTFSGQMWPLVPCSLGLVRAALGLAYYVPQEPRGAVSFHSCLAGFLLLGAFGFVLLDEYHKWVIHHWEVVCVEPKTLEEYQHSRKRLQQWAWFTNYRCASVLREIAETTRIDLERTEARYREIMGTTLREDYLQCCRE